MLGIRRDRAHRSPPCRRPHPRRTRVNGRATSSAPSARSPEEAPARVPPIPQERRLVGDALARARARGRVLRGLRGAEASRRSPPDVQAKRARATDRPPRNLPQLPHGAAPRPANPAQLLGARDHAPLANLAPPPVDGVRSAPGAPLGPRSMSRRSARSGSCNACRPALRRARPRRSPGTASSLAPAPPAR